MRGDRYLHFDWTQMMTLISLRPGLQWILRSGLFQLRPANGHHGARARNSRAARPARHFRRRPRLHDAGHHFDISRISRSGATGSFSMSSQRRQYGFLPCLVDQLAGLPRASRRHAAYRLRTELGRDHHVSEPARRARHLVRHSALADPRGAMDCTRTERPDADCHPGLWKPLRWLRLVICAGSPDCGGVLGPPFRTLLAAAGSMPPELAHDFQITPARSCRKRPQGRKRRRRCEDLIRHELICSRPCDCAG